MKILRYRDVEPLKIDNEVAKGVSGRVLIGKADGAHNFCMRIFELAPGGHTPRHTHEWEHEVFIHSGGGEVLFNSEWKPFSAGTAIFIPGEIEHQLRNNGDVPLIFLCLVPSGVPEL